MKQFNVVGKSYPRVEAASKTSGKAVYVGDMYRPNMLYGKLLRSPHAHANIKNIDASKALALPGVEAVLTYKDVPQIPFTTCGHPHPPDTPEDTRILSQRLRYVGDPVAAVAAVSADVAEEALGLIEVEYEVLPAYFTPEDALADGAIELHEGLHNIAGQNELELGEVDAAFAKAAKIIEDDFKTPIVTHTPIETHIQMAEIDPTGRLVLYAANQVPNIIRERMAKALGMKIGDIRVIRGNVGGGFGGKQETVYEPVTACLALKTRRPVMLELTREECIATTRTRHSSQIKLRTALDVEGNILARTMDITNNTGAYSAHGHNVIMAMMSKFLFMYPTPNLRFKGKSVYTNITIGSAMRGYGSPQVNFAMESHIEHIAAELGVDSLEYRQKVAFHMGDPIYSADTKIDTCGWPEGIDYCVKKLEYDKLKNAPKNDGCKKRGVGMALSVYNQSCYPHSVELSAARVSVNEDGTAMLFVNCSEIGQGSDTVMRQIAAEALGVPYDWMNVISGDTDLCPWDAGAYASRQTYVTGHAVKKAATACKNQILDWVAPRYSVNRERLDIKEGLVIDSENGGEVALLSDVMMKLYYSIHHANTVCHEEKHLPNCGPLTFGTTFAVVEVDTRTGKVEVVQLVSASDSGTIINPLAAMGQLNGGNIMGMGYAVSEQLLINPKTGEVYNDNLLDYKIPTFADLPDLDGHFVETDEPSSAYGNKSLGEPPVIPVAAAIRNAVYNATGVFINEIPLTPERVLMHLKAAETGKEG